MTASSLRIVLDWGTSSFRALLVDGHGHVLARKETDQGIQGMSRERFPEVLLAAVADWRAAHGPLKIYAAGMVGSRNGWVEMPYVPCPADAATLAAAVKRLTLEHGLDITFIPGLTDTAAVPFPDVMRGEETQLVGLGLQRDVTVVMPGTHSKWARIEGGRIVRFHTFLTGEMYGLLAKHSFVAKAAEKPSAPNFDAYARGLNIALAEKARAPGLLGRLFAVRSGWLAGEVAPAQMLDLLSGIVIGSEFDEAQTAGWFGPGQTIVLLGDDDMVDLYARAARAFGAVPEAGPADIAVTGVLTIAALAEEALHAVV
jgi:2-dehydro-3-deoxygalactonokinase